MRSEPRFRWALVAAFCTAVAALSAMVAWQGYRVGVAQLAGRGASDLALASDRLVSQLQRYRDFAVLLVDAPQLDALHPGQASAAVQAAERLLLEVSDRTGAQTLFYADAQGRILASAHGLVSDALPRTPYFRRAMHGALGATLGSSVGMADRAYSFAAPSFAADGTVRGTLVVVVDLAKLEADWRGARPAVYFTDETGRVFVTNRSELLFWQRDGAQGMADAAGRTRAATVGAVGPHRIWHQDWSPYVPAAALHLQKDLPVIGMVGEALIDVAPAWRVALLQAAAVAAICLFFGAIVFLLGERRRALSAANAVLEDRVASRTADLSRANTALRREVAERQEAEAALKKAQADLVQAGKLSALGQISAGISHELNQPLMAIRSYAENARTFLEVGRKDRADDNLGRISEMARRMARIIRNLRAFARQENEAIRRVDLVAVIDSALELGAGRLNAVGVRVDWSPPSAPVWVRGGEVRLGQVFVNLISNAADAMQESPERRLHVAITGARDCATGPLTVEVRDTGPGIEEPEKIFEPFYTTKAVGSGSGQEDGMGLGLSISYGLVQSFGGTIRGANVAGGGSVFTVELERWPEAGRLEAAE